MTAKGILLRYKKAKRKAKDIELRMAELRLKYSLPSSAPYSDMPHAHNPNHDLSDYSAKMDELEQLLIDQYSRCIGVEIDIYKRLDMMDNQSERELLQYRYIDDMTWEQIAKVLSYDVRHVYRLHGAALMHFPID
jgi:DNA-directed RNA polymerase specialized sigma subunit